MPQAFECKMCGHCCQGKGGIVMSEKDMARLAGFLEISTRELEEKHCQKRGTKLHLAVGEDNYCVFFHPDKGCGVHPGRPDICRAWPFFRGNLVDKTSWEMCIDYCPGINLDAGHEEFVVQGIKYLEDEHLIHNEQGGPNALNVK